MELSPDHLCPPVPNRLNYVLWLQDLLTSRDEAARKVEMLRNNGAYKAPEPKEKDYQPRSQLHPIAAGSSVDEPAARNRKRRKLTSSDPSAATASTSPPSSSGLVPSPAQSDPSRQLGRPRQRMILDIGTGASLIYPLLGCSLDPDWHFVATDVDAKSVANAHKILRQAERSQIQVAEQLQQRETSSSPPVNARLPLSRRINILLRGIDDPLLPTHGDLKRVGSPRSGAAPTMPATEKESVGEAVLFDATLCNPPFYASRDEMARSAAGKRKAPNAVCTGTSNEMVYEAGGEVGFVKRLIADSLEVSQTTQHLLQQKQKSKIGTWYTSMVGFKASLKPITSELRERGIDNWFTDRLMQGQTRRWLVAWSFSPLRLGPPLRLEPALDNDPRIALEEGPGWEAENGDDDLDASEAQIQGESNLGTSLPSSHPLIFESLRSWSMDTSDEEASRIVASWIQALDADVTRLRPISSRAPSGDSIIRKDGADGDAAWLVGARFVSWNRAGRRKAAYAAALRRELQERSGNTSTSNTRSNQFCELSDDELARLIARESQLADDYLMVAEVRLVSQPQSESTRTLSLLATWLYGEAFAPFQSFCDYLSATTTNHVA